MVESESTRNDLIDGGPPLKVGQMKTDLTHLSFLSILSNSFILPNIILDIIVLSGQSRTVRCEYFSNFFHQVKSIPIQGDPDHKVRTK